MSQRRKKQKKPARRQPQQPPSVPFILDQFSVDDIQKWEEIKDKILKFQWDYYNDLAYQRSKISDKLTESLWEASEKTSTFSRWQRIIRYKYALEPLSVDGSIINPGGRFNIGEINPAQFPPFPALYVASDRITALQEVLSQKIKPSKEEKALEFALANRESIVNISLSGSLESVINLLHPEKLKKFANLLKEFSLSKNLIKTAEGIKQPEPALIRSTDGLLQALLDKNWRALPMQADVPATSQIFGQLVVQAGIEGIRYKSKFNNKECLVIFPQNFKNSDSYVQLDDEPPPGTQFRRLDANTWKEIARKIP